jgi:hypothetical protein
VGDAETVAVAARFEAQQAERLAVLERKLAAQEEELALVERDVAAMTAEFKRAAAGIPSGAAGAASPTRAPRPRWTRCCAAPRPGPTPAPPRSTRWHATASARRAPRAWTERLAELKRRMGK